MAKDNAPTREIVRRKGDGDAIGRENTNAEFSHLASGSREQLVPILELDAEGGAGQHLGNDAFDFNGFFLHGYVLARGFARSCFVNGRAPRACEPCLCRVARLST